MTTTLHEQSGLPGGAGNGRWPEPPGFLCADSGYRSTALPDRLRATEYFYLDAAGHADRGRACRKEGRDMSGTTIATSKVTAILLADGWHRIIQGSFSVAALRFGAEADPGVVGFCCEEADTGSPYRPATLAGPLNSVLAVRQVASARQTRELGHLAASRWAHSAPEAVA